MAYLNDGLKHSLKKLQTFVDIIDDCGYGSHNLHLEHLIFEKAVKKSSDGAEEYFKLELSVSLSGISQVHLKYTKKLAESSDTLGLSIFVGNKEDSLKERIRLCEEKCLLIGNNFNK